MEWEWIARIVQRVVLGTVNRDSACLRKLRTETAEISMPSETENRNRINSCGQFQAFKHSKDLDTAATRQAAALHSEMAW